MLRLARGRNSYVPFTPNPACQRPSLSSPRQAPSPHTKTNSSMKTLPTAFLIGLAAVAISSAWAEDSEAMKKDKATLHAEVIMVYRKDDGRKMHPEGGKSR